MHETIEVIRNNTKGKESKRHLEEKIINTTPLYVDCDHGNELVFMNILEYGSYREDELAKEKRRNKELFNLIEKVNRFN